MNEERVINDLGRYLTNILRHRAAELRLKIKPDGYVFVKDILSLPEKTRSRRALRSHTLEDVLMAVERDSKTRMSVRGSGAGTEIRANQGHSLKNIDDESLLRKIYSPSELPVLGLCVHGTYYGHLTNILNNGLKSMTRKHVHFSTQPFGSKKTISGMRSNCQVLIYLDVKKALEEGLQIYLSSNEVALVPDMVPTHLFEKICEASTGKKIIF